LISGIIANLGLSQILKVSVPVLSLVYPMAITLIILGLFHDRLPFNRQPVYVMTIGLVGIYSLMEVINSTFLNGSFSGLLAGVPLQTNGFGWVLPGLLGFMLGSIFEKITVNKDTTVKKAA
jgi:LIVCS family branched-chain amino acid:cation transporter